MRIGIERQSLSPIGSIKETKNPQDPISISRDKWYQLGLEQGLREQNALSIFLIQMLRIEVPTKLKATQILFSIYIGSSNPEDIQKQIEFTQDFLFEHRSKKARSLSRALNRLNDEFKDKSRAEILDLEYETMIQELQDATDGSRAKDQASS